MSAQISVIGYCEKAWKEVMSFIVFIFLWLWLALPAWAAVPDLNLDDVSKVSDTEIAFAWQGQGTLMCGGQALNAVVDVVQDLPRYSSIHCWIEYADGPSNRLHLQ